MKIVMQDGIKDCGICSLLSIIRYYGGDASKEYLREITNTTKSGVNAYQLINAAKMFGLNSYGLKGDITMLENVDLPCIAHVVYEKSYQHFVVIYSIDEIKKKIVIMDPARGKKIISFAEFSFMTSKHFLIFKPIKKVPNLISDKVMKKIIFSFFKQNKHYLVYTIILSILTFLFYYVTTYHFKYLLDNGISYQLTTNIFVISYLIGIIYLLKEISAFLRNVILMKWNLLLDEKLTVHIYNQIIALPYLYYKNRTTGEIISRIKDLNEIKQFISRIISSICVDVVAWLVFCFFLVKLDYRLFFLVIILFLFLFLLNLIFYPIIEKQTKKYYRKNERLNSYLIESFSSFEMIKGLHLEVNIISKFQETYKKLLLSMYKLTKTMEGLNFLKNVITYIFLTIILGLGSIYVISEEISLGSFIIFQGILSYYFVTFKNMVNLILDYQRFKLCLDRVNDLYQLKREKFNGYHHYENIDLRGNILFKGLSFNYNSVPIIDQLTLKIEDKDKVFFHGSSGTGKSTLMKILMRYIEIPFGFVSINGIDINHYHLDIIRKKISYVPQTEYLFTDTLYKNIVIDRKIDDETFEKICKLTKVDEIIKHDELGYHKLIEENGFNLSGGERQRISLARCLMKESDIYIFDEALSQIDVSSEREILTDLLKYLKDKTVIVISHRFHNKDLFKRVVKMEKGRSSEKRI